MNGINSLLFPVYPDLAYELGDHRSVRCAECRRRQSIHEHGSVKDNLWYTNFDSIRRLGGDISIDELFGSFQSC